MRRFDAARCGSETRLWRVRNFSHGGTQGRRGDGNARSPLPMRGFARFTRARARVGCECSCLSRSPNQHISAPENFNVRFTPRGADQSEQVAKQVASAQTTSRSPNQHISARRDSLAARPTKASEGGGRGEAAPPPVASAQNLSSSRIGTGRRSRALRIAASSTHCVFSASSKSGIETTGDPPATIAEISAAWLMNPCS